MIPLDLSANCEGWIYDPKGSWIQMLGIRSRDPFSGSTDMSVSGGGGGHPPPGRAKVAQTPGRARVKASKALPNQK